MRAFDPTYDYRADTLIRKDGWEKYNRGQPTKFVFTVAQPQNLEAVEGEIGSVINSTRTLAEIYDGPVMTIEVKMGRNKGSLSKPPIDGLIKHFTQGQGATEDVRKLSATSVNEDGSEEINFLNDFLRETRDVEVPEGDPDGHYSKRISWVATCYNMHFDYFKEVYGASNVVVP